MPAFRDAISGFSYGEFYPGAVVAGEGYYRIICYPFFFQRMPEYCNIGIEIFYHGAQGASLLFALEIAGGGSEGHRQMGHIISEVKKKWLVLSLGLDDVNRFLGVKMRERTIRRFIDLRFAVSIDFDGGICFHVGIAIVVAI